MSFGPNSAFTFPAPPQVLRRQSSHPVPPPLPPLLDKEKPFVYTREFLLSLYLEEKAGRRPIELGWHEVATVTEEGKGGRPWALREWREGEKGLFSATIHPPTPLKDLSKDPLSAANGRRLPPPTTTGTTLDLSTLQTLPRDRTTIAGSSRTRTTSSGILGGVLGGIGGVGGGGRKEGGGKEVWMGGRWRRGNTGDEAGGGEKKQTPPPSPPPPTTTTTTKEVAEDSGVPASWDSSSDRSSTPPPPPQNPLPSQPPTHQTPHYSPPPLPSSLLDSPDPLLSSLPPPPGLLTPLPQQEKEWEYRDPTGVIQGPFKPSLMHEWYQQSYFTGDLLVRRVGEEGWETLEGMRGRSGDWERCFLVAKGQPVSGLNGLNGSGVGGVNGNHNGNAKIGGGGWEIPTNVLSGGGGGAFGGIPIPFDTFSVGGQGSPFLQQQQQPIQQQQQQPQYGFVSSPIPDPWRAPLPALNSWNSGGWDGGFGAGQQQALPQQQQQPWSQPQASQLPRQSSPFFDSSFPSSTVGVGGGGDWRSTNNTPWAQNPLPQQQQQPLPLPLPLPLPQQQQGGRFNNNNNTSYIPQPQQQPIQPIQQFVSSTIEPPAPIGPPTPAPAPSTTAWDLPPPPPAPISLPEEPIISLPPPPPRQPTPPPPREPTPPPREPTPPPPREPTPPPPDPIVAPKPPTPPTTPAPWLIEETPKPSTPTASIRQIQESESRISEARRTAERQAAARIQALAAVQAAQRAAAAEAEMLPSSSTWATSEKKVAAAVAPWLKTTGGGGKTLKEIQEEEERRKKAERERVAATVGVSAAGVRGYAGAAIQNTKTAPGAPWTTVAVKPSSIPSIPASKPVVPGGSILRGAATLPAKPQPATVVPRSVPSVQVVQAPKPSGSVAVKYDADHPPPPSNEFMKWCKDALTGLTVPMDEFIQMLLSFPLDASADVLEIISDSVYANSSTLDGRRFANDFSSRRKLDVTARYPSIVVKSAPKGTAGGGKPSSMAEALKQQPVAKTPEWQVRVGGSKKKKGGK